MTTIMEARDVVKRFGGLTAVDGVSMSLAAGTILGLIGPNGSGKTTFLGVLAGTHAPSEGTVFLHDRPVSGKGPRHNVRAGIGRTFQTTRLFPTRTLGQSMRLARGERDRRRPVADFGVGEIAGALGLEVGDVRPCGSLSGASQRLAMIAVALSTAPSVLLLDEPAVGLDTSEATVLAEAIRHVRTEFGVAIVVVDHNMHFLMPLADIVTVMALGRVLASGTPSEVRANESVIASYLGS